MKVALVHSFYTSAQPSGENTVVQAQAEALRRAGHEVYLIARHTDVEAAKPLYKARALFSAAHLTGPDPGPALDEFEPEVVHVHNLFPNWGTSWLDRWGQRTVATLHNYRTVCAAATLWRDGGDCTECLDHGSIRAVENKCYRNSTIATLPLAWSTRSKGTKSPVLMNSKALVVLNSAAHDKFSALFPNAEVNLIPNFATEIGDHTRTDGGENWIYVGRLVPEKGILWLLENWPSDRQLDIVGAGPLTDTVAQAAKSQPERFRFHGALDHSAVQQQISNARGLVLPSLWSEGIPTVALEALHAGTPVVISDRCASADELTAGGSGEIFSLDGGNLSLTAALARVELDEDIRTRAYTAYQRQYSEDAWIQRIDEVYRRIADAAK
ncbi:probable glycosyltransferase [Rhodococcus jostii RHA1]|uniref:Probable glycosyltransferase n=1 Tax=Rhodococcus jostii (strain RHA1) TaxID=101510 RepID=Q0S5G4_RHOJR|nr:glycosyltransferase family 4 protein [Rhodococcus jostii]ABG97222.1 probable glycosyltransferase [Rhodococcus jostii RHA1]